MASAAVNDAQHPAGSAGSGDQPTRDVFVRAAVLCGSVETTYRRAGVGPSVVLLIDGARLDAEHLAPLITRCRVIIPDTTNFMALLPSGSGDESPFARWLRLFLEGLGVASVRIVASAPLAKEVARFAEREPDLVTRVLLVHGVPESWDDLGEQLFAR